MPGSRENKEGKKKTDHKTGYPQILPSVQRKTETEKPKKARLTKEWKNWRQK